MACVSCVCWVNKGIAKRVPDKVSLEKDEVQALLFAKDSERLNDDDSDAADNTDDSYIEALYDLDNYSDDSDADQKGSNIRPSMVGLASFASSADDPYLSTKDSDGEDSDNSDYIIEPSDNLLLVGHADSDHSSVEVHVYNEEDNNHYCHHEVLINAHPLAVEWLDYDPGQPDVKGNFFAVGTILPVIEIWDIDLVNAAEPVTVLGELSPSNKPSKKSKAKLKQKVAEHSHSDAIIGLSWNRCIRSVLASASADHTVRIWDLSEGRLLVVLEHPDKVQTLQWHPSNPSLLASGCYDGIVRLYNCEDGTLLKHWKFKGEIEKVLWNHFSSNQLLVSTDQMKVVCIDTDKDIMEFSLDAHSEAVTDMSISLSIKGLLLTSSIDDSICFWNIDQTKNPKLLCTRNLHLGGVLCARFCSDSPNVVAVGGESSEFKLMNLQSIPSLLSFFKEDESSHVSNSLSPPNTKPPKKKAKLDAEKKNEERSTHSDQSPTQAKLKHLKKNKKSKRTKQ